VKAYKVLNTDRSACHGGSGKWPKPGVWLPKKPGPLTQERACGDSVYHYCTRDQLVCWLGPAIWEIEVGRDRLDVGDKSICLTARLLRRLPWTKQVQRNFAADCAGHVLHFFEERYPDDKRPRLAIEAARSGQVSAANANAANAAAYAAHADAAAAADYAVHADAAAAADCAAAYAAAYAAHAAADAAADATAHAANAAAYADYAERKWQTKRLFQIIAAAEKVEKK
jgi:Imm-5 like putative immunity protein